MSKHLFGSVGYANLEEDDEDDYQTHTPLGHLSSGREQRPSDLKTVPATVQNSERKRQNAQWAERLTDQMFKGNHQKSNPGDDRELNKLADREDSPGSGLSESMRNDLDNFKNHRKTQVTQKTVDQMMEGLGYEPLDSDREENDFFTNLDMRVKKHQPNSGFIEPSPSKQHEQLSSKTIQNNQVPQFTLPIDQLAAQIQDRPSQLTHGQENIANTGRTGSESDDKKKTQRQRFEAKQPDRGMHILQARGSICAYNQTTSLNTCGTERSCGGGKSGDQSEGTRKIKKVTVIQTKGMAQTGKSVQPPGKSKKNKHNSKDNNISKKLGRNNEKTRFMDSLKSEDVIDAKRGPRFQKGKSSLKSGSSRQRASKSPNNPFRTRAGISQERVRKISTRNLYHKDAAELQQRQTGPQIQAIAAIAPNSGEPANQVVNQSASESIMSMSVRNPYALRETKVNERVQRSRERLKPSNFYGAASPVELKLENEANELEETERFQSMQEASRLPHHTRDEQQFKLPSSHQLSQDEFKDSGQQKDFNEKSDVIQSHRGEVGNYSINPVTQKSRKQMNMEAFAKNVVSNKKSRKLSGIHGGEQKIAKTFDATNGDNLPTVPFNYEDEHKDSFEALSQPKIIDMSHGREYKMNSAYLKSSNRVVLQPSVERVEDFGATMERSFSSKDMQQLGVPPRGRPGFRPIPAFDSPTDGNIVEGDSMYYPKQVAQSSKRAQSHNRLGKIYQGQKPPEVNNSAVPAETRKSPYLFNASSRGGGGIERRKSLKNLLSDRPEDSSRAGDGPENIQDRYEYDPDSGRAHISKDKVIVKQRSALNTSGKQAEPKEEPSSGIHSTFFDFVGNVFNYGKPKMDMTQPSKRNPDLYSEEGDSKLQENKSTNNDIRPFEERISQEQEIEGLRYKVVPGRPSLLKQQKAHQKKQGERHLPQSLKEYQDFVSFAQLDDPSSQYMVKKEEKTLKKDTSAASNEFNIDAKSLDQDPGLPLAKNRQDSKNNLELNSIMLDLQTPMKKFIDGMPQNNPPQIPGAFEKQDIDDSFVTSQINEGPVKVGEKMNSQSTSLLIKQPTMTAIPDRQRDKSLDMVKNSRRMTVKEGNESTYSKLVQFISGNKQEDEENPPSEPKSTKFTMKSKSPSQSNLSLALQKQRTNKSSNMLSLKSGNQAREANKEASQEAEPGLRHHNSFNMRQRRDQSQNRDQQKRNWDFRTKNQRRGLIPNDDFDSLRVPQNQKRSQQQASDLDINRSAAYTASSQQLQQSNVASSQLGPQSQQRQFAQQHPSQHSQLQRQQQPEPESGGLFSFFKGFFGKEEEPLQKGRHSAETKASSSQTQNDKQTNFDGCSPRGALDTFGPVLTEFEKIELGLYERIYTIGSVRRDNQYSLVNKEGYYITQVGEQIGYRYEISKIVDQGAFGQVVRCEDWKYPSKPTVAAKITKNKKFDVDNANVEIKYLKKLKEGRNNKDADIEGCNRVVEVLDHFKFRQHVIIIFELLNLNLYKYMKANKMKMPLFQPLHLQRIVFQICQGLKYLRNQQIIHCDLKPENILFTDAGFNNIKIIDFGASCNDHTNGFFYVQSRYYRAPEIVLGAPYDFAVDMWSLGCIVYELITGKPLFPAQDENELVEYFILTVGRVPEHMFTKAKKYSQFYQKTTSLLGLGYNHELIRSPVSRNPPKIAEQGQTVRHLLTGKADLKIIDFIEQCLVLDPAERLKPSEALDHPWFSEE